VFWITFVIAFYHTFSGPLQVLEVEQLEAMAKSSIAIGNNIQAKYSKFLAKIRNKSS